MRLNVHDASHGRGLAAVRLTVANERQCHVSQAAINRGIEPTRVDDCGSDARWITNPAPRRVAPTVEHDAKEWEPVARLPSLLHAQAVCAASYPFKRMSLDARPWVSERSEVV
ncbi:hypothetical protein D3C71_1606810 [compost metagenome]